MAFTWKKYDDMKLTIFSADGKVTADEWIRAIEDYNSSGATRLELYDVRRATADFYGTEMQKLHYGTKPETSTRSRGDKTAILVDRPSQYGLSRIYTSYAEAGGVPWEINIFYSPDEAGKWLGVDLRGLIPPNEK